MKMQLTPRFPASIVGGPGIAVTVANGVYTFSLSSSVFWIPLRVVTAAGPATVNNTESGVAINKAVAGPTTVYLPPSPTRTGGPVSVKDAKGDANANNITVLPDPGTPGDLIDTHASDVINTNFGARSYSPVAGVGWLRT